MIRSNKFMKIMFRFIFLGLTSLGVSSCDLTNNVSVVEKYPLCIPSQQLVIVDWDENKQAKEVTFYPDFRTFSSKSPYYRALLKNKGTTLAVFFYYISTSLHLNAHQLIDFDGVRFYR